MASSEECTGAEVGVEMLHQRHVAASTDRRALLPARWLVEHGDRSEQGFAD